MKKRIIFLHNGFDSAETWKDVESALGDRVRTVSYNRPGYGVQADAEDIPIHAGDIIADGATELEKIRCTKGWDRFVLCGHCIGGAIALRYVSLHPGRVIGVFGESVGLWSDPAMRLKAELIFGDYDGADPGLRTRMERWHGAERARTLWRIIKDNRSDYIQSESYSLLSCLKILTIPVCLIYGDRDPYFGKDYLGQVRRQMPEADIRTVSRCGHDIHLEKPDIFMRLLEDFFEKSYHDKEALNARFTGSCQPRVGEP